MKPHVQASDDWLTRETRFAAFSTGPLLNFWRQREEDHFNGVDGLPIHFVRFCSPKHQQAIVICPGRGESYVKYSEVAYDLFRHGYDVLILDHRGQGRSARLLPDSHRGHVEHFSDYVDDLERFWHREVSPRGYLHCFALSHSMGGAILARFLARQPQAFDAVVFCAPMFGIQLPMPRMLAEPLLNWAEQWELWRNYYAAGSGQWRPLPYLMNVLTHSRERYQRNMRFSADYPELQVGGPTYHWVRESLRAGDDIIRDISRIRLPVLLLQASEERVVDNESHQLFCQALAAAGNPCHGNAPQVIEGARHEILFEQDPQRVEALSAILNFFAAQAKVHLAASSSASHSRRG